MQVLGYPMDARSQIARSRLRFWLTLIVSLHLLITASRDNLDDDRDLDISLETTTSVTSEVSL